MNEPQSIDVPPSGGMIQGELAAELSRRQAAYEKELADQVDSTNRMDAELRSDKRRAAISEALSGRRFAGPLPAATEEIVRKLLEGEIEAVRDDRGKLHVRDRRTLRAAGEYLKERVASQEFAIFFAESHPGDHGGAHGSAYARQTSGDPNAAFAAAFRQRREDARNARF